MPDLHKRLWEAISFRRNLRSEQTATLPQKKTQLQRHITTADRQIDPLVYELYDLTPEEIQIVEDAVR